MRWLVSAKDRMGNSPDRRGAKDSNLDCRSLKSPRTEDHDTMDTIGWGNHYGRSPICPKAALELNCYLASECFRTGCSDGACKSGVMRRRDTAGDRGKPGATYA